MSGRRREGRKLEAAYRRCAVAVPGQSRVGEEGEVEHLFLISFFPCTNEVDGKKGEDALESDRRTER